MKKNLLFILKILFTIFIILLFLFFLIEYLFFRYSNNYITIDLYNKNKEIFELIKEDITNNIGKIGVINNKRCDDYSRILNKIVSCKYNFSLYSQEITNKLNISKITVTESLIDNSFEITFWLGESKYIQNKSPVLIYQSKVLEGNKGLYLPFPMSNNYFYIGSDSINLDEHWYTFSYFE